MLTLSLGLFLSLQDATGLEPFTLGPKPERTLVTVEHLPGRVHVKTSAASGLRDLEADSRLLAIVSQAGGRLVPLMPVEDDLLDAWVEAARQRSGRPLHDLSLFHRIDVDPARVADLCDALNREAVVELAWPAPSGGDPAVCLAPSAMLSPSYTAQQGYRSPAPLGVDANYAHTFPSGRGAGERIIDIETGWTFDHEDFGGKLIGGQIGGTPANYPWDHGTATMAEVLAVNDNSGVLGIAHEADGFYVTHTPLGGSFNLPAALVTAAMAAVPGDTLMIEVQCFGGPPGPFPCEFDAVNFATIQTATASGVHVIAAAGNGGFDLDSPSYGGAFDLNLKDSGAILVGATDAGALLKASFSNFGSRVTSNGWGREVVTAGYGDLQPGPATQEYTATFSGTSSATPIVAGAAMLLNAIHRSALGSPVDPLTLRAVLRDTGTPSGGNIGTRPDLRAALAGLGIPRLSSAGSTGPGGLLSLVQDGVPSSFAAIYAATAPQVPPLPIEPFGELLLQPGLAFPLTSGLLDGAGHLDTALPLPPTGPLAGTTLWLQSVHVFPGAAGGSFTNVITYRLE
jgi:serine protease